MALDAQTRGELIAAVRRFVTGRLRPLEAQVAEEDAIPDAVVDEMRGLGLFGLSIPEDYEGLGLGMEDECLVALELGRTSPAFRSVVGTNIGIGSQGLVLAGSDAQKRRWLPRIASGEIITAFCLTEAEAGSDSASVRTRARRASGGDDYVLDGAKRYITNADKASLFTVMARTNPDEPGSKGISAFLVPADTPGVSLGKPERKMGQHGAHVCDVTFDGARVPAANRLGAEGEGFKLAMRVLDRGRLHIAAVCTGLADRILEDALAYAGGRRQFGQPLTSFQLVQAMIADSKTEILAARALVLDAARQRDAGQPTTLEAAAAKLFASEMVGRVADRAVQMLGGAGYIADYGIERFYRDVRLFRIYEGSSEIQKLVIARETLKRGG